MNLFHAGCYARSADMVRVLEIRQTVEPMASTMRNAYIDFSKMTTSVVALITDVERDGRRVVGYGFNSNGRYAPRGILEDRVMPRLLAAAPADLLNDDGSNFDPGRMWQLMLADEKPGGHGERSTAVGTLDMAIWDAVAKIESKPLYRLLAERYRGAPADERVWVYAAGGYYQPDKDVTALQDEMRRYLDLGYQTVKIKIGGAPLADDLARIEAVLELLGGDGSRLCVDANGRFDLATALGYAQALAPYGLRWYEEPGDPLDYALMAEIAQAYGPPLATGENLFSHQDARNLLRYGGLRPTNDVLQFDCALSYGLVEYLRTLEVMRELGWAWARLVPHGGHQMSLNIAAGLGLGGNESYPGVFQPFGGFADDLRVEGGFVRLPDSPGIGFERKQALYDVMRRLAA